MSWFDLDVVVAIIAALAQAVTGCLGWAVSVDRVSVHRKRIFKWIFAIATLCGLIATVMAAHRNFSLIGELHAKMHVDGFHFLLPQGVVIKPDPSLIGSPLTGMLGSTNRGALPVQHLAVACELTISPVLDPVDEDRLFDRLAVDQKDRLEQPNRNEVLQGDNQGFACVTKDKLPLTKEQYEQMMYGTEGKEIVVYLTLLMRYTDKLGKDLTTENCWHIYLYGVGAGGSPVDCPNHNR